VKAQPSVFLLVPLLLAPPLAGQEKPAVGAGLRQERERLASYQWRLKTEMKVDGETRLQKSEQVHLGPDGGLVRRTVKYDRAPQPTPLPYGDPRGRLDGPTSGQEDDRLFDQAQALMDLYARLTPERVEEWAVRAELLPEDPDRKGLVRLHGRGLGRPQDDAVLYLEKATRNAAEIEVKTTVDEAIVDIAFLRATFEPLKLARPGLAPVVVPKRIFLNMSRGKRRVTLEMDATEYRAWP